MRRPHGGRATCQCAKPIPYEEAGDGAACLKCGHWLSASPPARAEADPSPLNLEASAAPALASGRPEPRSRDRTLGTARPHDSGKPPPPPVAPERGSGQTFDWPFSPSEGRTRESRREAEA